MQTELPAWAAGEVWTMRQEQGQEPRGLAFMSSWGQGDRAVLGIIEFLLSLRKLPKQTLRILRSLVKQF